MGKATDIRPDAVSLHFLTVRARVPLKAPIGFGFPGEPPPPFGVFISNSPVRLQL